MQLICPKEIRTRMHPHSHPPVLVGEVDPLLWTPEYRRGCRQSRIPFVFIVDATAALHKFKLWLQGREANSRARARIQGQKKSEQCPPESAGRQLLK